MWSRKGDTSSATSDGWYCSPDGTLSKTRSIQSHRSFCISSEASTSPFVPGTPSAYSFTVIDDEGRVVKDFEPVHTKLMHVIVARKDLGQFQHLHPEFDAVTGEFALADLVLPTAGEYRIYADFMPRTSQLGRGGTPLGVTIHEDVVAGDRAGYVPQPLGDDTRADSVDGFQVSLHAPQPLTSGRSQELSFEMTKGGEAVTDLQEYLGALGHVVVLREGSLDFIHAHPLEGAAAQSGRVGFAITFPGEGRYKIFPQFQHQGRVLTSSFVATIAPGGEEEATDHGTMGHE
jgi:hypothetical protein